LSWWRSPGGENQETEGLKATVKALEALGIVVAAQQKSIDDLESAQRLLKLEWTDTLDRLNRMTGRLNARIKKSEVLESPESDEPETRKGVAPVLQPTGTHSLLAQARTRRGLLPG